MRVAAILVALLISIPSLAQEEPEPEVDGDSSSRLVAAGWCVVRDGERGEGEPGCDVGVGVALYRLERLSVVAALGVETVGVGLSWTVHKPSGSGPIVAVAAGAIVPYGSDGIDASKLYPSLGATFAFGGVRD